MLTYVLNRGGETSLYEQLYRALRADIESGVLAAGARLPSKRAFAKHLGVSVVTVEGAFRPAGGRGLCACRAPQRLLCAGNRPEFGKFFEGFDA
ncbi:MAG: GntR family transcriptional regulator [Adlercreutzia equolifaciens]